MIFHVFLIKDLRAVREDFIMQQPDLGFILHKQLQTKIGITLTAQSEMGQGTTLEMTFSTENDFDKTLT